MNAEEFRHWGRAAIDWIADYMEGIERYPVLSRVKPGEIRAMLPESPPANGDTFEQIFADLDRVIMPGITHWQSPNFYAYFPANTSGPSILGDLISSGLGDRHYDDPCD
jgi:aromatic-L-amino-acid decarboxylase